MKRNTSFVKNFLTLFLSLVTASILSSALRVSHCSQHLIPRSSKPLAARENFDSDGAIKDIEHLHLMEHASKSYDSLIIDQWGVLHDGKTPYPGVVECLKNLKSLGKRLILLSNSSKRKSSSFKGLNKVGIDSLLFDDIVTSGEMAWNAISERRFEFVLDNGLIDSDFVGTSDSKCDKKLKVFVVGNNDDDIQYISSCGCVASSPETADFVLARGTFCFYTGPPLEKNSGTVGNAEPDSMESTRSSLIENGDPLTLLSPSLDGIISFEKAEDLIAVVDSYLERCIARNLPMLVSNPDFHRPGSGAPMPGQIGKKYSDLGGVVQYIGKPYGTVYDACLAILGDSKNGLNSNDIDDILAVGSGSSGNSNGHLAVSVPKGGGTLDLSRVCGVGDSLDHDIDGARRAGIDSIWTANGVHSGEMGSQEGSVVLADDEVLQGMFRKYGVTPTHTVASFHW